MVFHAKKHRALIVLRLRGEQAGDWYEQLASQKADIEGEVGHSLDWESTDSSQTRNIMCVKECVRLVDLENEEFRREVLDWYISMLNVFHEACVGRVLATSSDNSE